MPSYYWTMQMVQARTQHVVSLYQMFNLVHSWFSNLMLQICKRAGRRVDLSFERALKYCVLFLDLTHCYFVFLMGWIGKCPCYSLWFSSGNGLWCAFDVQTIIYAASWMGGAIVFISVRPGDKHRHYIDAWTAAEVPILYSSSTLLRNNVCRSSARLWRGLLWIN